MRNRRRSATALSLAALSWSAGTVSKAAAISTGYGLTVPEAFSATGHTHELPHASLDSVLQILSKYEIDTHFEVVLVGTGFTHAKNQELATRLETLAKVSAAASPLTYVHEKIIYHTTLGSVLLDPVREAIFSNSVVDPSKIGKVFADYHSRAATTTTLFVYQDDSQRQYSYSSLLPYCSQMAFIARDSSFAWIDISATAQQIEPAVKGSEILVSSTRAGNANELASLLHSSGEALSPFPHPSFRALDFTTGGTTGVSGGSKKSVDSAFDAPSSHYYRQRREGLPLSRPPPKIHIMIITVCMDGLENTEISCEEDLKTLMVVDQLIRLYSSSSLQISSGISLLKASDEPQVAHAIHASLSYSSPASNQDSNNAAASAVVVTISSSELIHWLQQSTIVRNLVLKSPHNEADTLLLPVFVLRTPPSLEIFFDESYQQTLAVPFSIGHQSIAVAAIRYSGSSGPPVGSLAKVHPVLRCAGTILPPGEGYADDQMRHAIREAIWGISPPRFHYSGSSRSIVQDFLWATPPALRRLGSSINGAESFREKRAVYRHVFINRAEGVLRRFADAIRLAASIVPPVNTSQLLEVLEPPPQAILPSANPTSAKGERGKEKGKGQAKAKGKRGQGLAARQPTSVSKVSRTSVVAKKGRGLLEEFLFFMRDAAADFSHLEYESALAHLESADVKAHILESRISDVISTRTGAISCNSSTAAAGASTFGTHGTLSAVTSSVWSATFQRCLLGLVGTGLGCLIFFLLEENASKRGGRRKRV